MNRRRVLGANEGQSYRVPSELLQGCGVKKTLSTGLLFAL